MISNDKLSFIICTEKGSLEIASKLLIESIRKHGGKLSNTPIYSYQPRVGSAYNISDDTKKYFDDNEVEYINTPLNVDYIDYPLANKPFVCAHAEQHIKSEFLVFLDSDVVILNEPLNFLLDDDYDVSLSPVDMKNIGVIGANDKNYDYWIKLYNIVGNTNYRYVTSTVDKKEIFEYYNSGHIIKRNGINLFQTWKDNFVKVMQNNLIPSDGIYFIEQSVLSATVSAMDLKVKELPGLYNYPIHMHNQYSFLHEINKRSEIVSIHHHNMFFNGAEPEKLDTFTVKMKNVIGC